MSQVDNIKALLEGEFNPNKDNYTITNGNEVFFKTAPEGVTQEVAEKLFEHQQNFACAVVGTTATEVVANPELVSNLVNDFDPEEDGSGWGQVDFQAEYMPGHSVGGTVHMNYSPKDGITTSIQTYVESDFDIELEEMAMYLDEKLSSFINGEEDEELDDAA